MEALFSADGFGTGAGPLYLQLQRRIADAKIEAVAVADLLVAIARTGRIPVKNSHQQRYIVGRIDL